MLDSLHDEAESKAVLAMDLFVARDQWEMSRGMTLWKGLYLIWGQTQEMLLEMKLYYGQRRQVGVTLFILAAVRSILSRFWLKFYLQGTFFPAHDPYLAALVSISVLTSFVTGWFWMMLVYKVLIQYRFTLAQVIILTAIADPDRRMQYVETVLQSGSWFGLTPDECVVHMQNMPLMDLCVAGNAETFWDMRDYVALDRSSDTLACSMLLEITVLWVVIKVGITVHTMFTSETLPAMMSVTLFDLLTFGVLLILVMQASLQINNLLDSHAHMLTEAKFSVSMHIATKKNRDDEDSKKQTSSGKLARKLLDGQLEMAREYESRDKIFFGSTVTPGKILSCAFMGFSSGATMIEEMIAKGTIKQH